MAMIIALAIYSFLAVTKRLKGAGIMTTATELGLKIVGIIHTHAHLDHILAAG